jgi:hypothetical protein
MLGTALAQAQHVWLCPTATYPAANLPRPFFWLRLRLRSVAATEMLRSRARSLWCRRLSSCPWPSVADIARTNGPPPPKQYRDPVAAAVSGDIGAQRRCRPGGDRSMPLRSMPCGADIFCLGDASLAPCLPGGTLARDPAEKRQIVPRMLETADVTGFGNHRW